MAAILALGKQRQEGQKFKVIHEVQGQHKPLETWSLKWEAAGWVGGHVHTFRYTQYFLDLETMMSHVCVLILVSQQKNQGPGQGRERAREPEYLQNAESCCRVQEAPQWLPQTNRAGKHAVVRQAHSASQ